LVSADGKEMNPDYATDYPAIHPNAKGYEVMEGLLLPVIKKMR
jgi:lysophospholipase L1-like esterase